MQVLDLSYNSLSADSITCIGGIPHLKVLHLTGNQLHRLPPDLGFPHHVASRQLVALAVFNLVCSTLTTFNCQITGICVLQ